MLLSEAGLSTRQINAFKKKNIETTEELVRLFPKKYHDYSVAHPLTQSINGLDTAIQGVLIDLKTDKKNGIALIKGKVKENVTNNILIITWIGSYFLKNIIKEWVDKEVIVGGTIQYVTKFNNPFYSVLNPYLFELNPEAHKKIYKENKSIKGVSDDTLNEVISKVLVSYPENDTVPKEVITKYSLMDINSALRTMHNPRNLSQIEKARKRIVFNQLIYFAREIKLDARNHSKGTSYNLRTKKVINTVIQSLPYELTADQKKAVDDLTEKMKDGRRIDVLLQGDVGYGKTIVAFLLSLGMAESGYQSVILAPLQQLAYQHFIELSEMAKNYGIKIAYLDGTTKASEKKEITNGIKNGEYSIVVGTHSLFSDDITYKNLAFVVIDEEQKFGVEQRNKMYSKAIPGYHRISMSATPMPRTITDIIYDDSCKEICNIKTKPKEKLEIKTQIYDNSFGIMKFMENQIREGHQCYSVCPLIEKNETSDKMDGVKSTEEIYKEYCEYFSKKGIAVAMVTGKTSAEETEQTFDDFRNNRVKIMVSTTVIEVGINVPNATVIVINNAERFGLSTLHQLRGRVGRGKYQSYCLLNSTQKENDRLNIIQSTTDGFQIAEADCKLRGSGNILGTEQSGNNKYIDLIMEYPNMYKKIKEIADQILDQEY